MSQFKARVIVGSATLGLGTLVQAAQPPDPVQSDSLGDTAVGTGAMALFNSTGFAGNSTAVGFNALQTNPTPLESVAIGAFAMQQNNGSTGIAVGFSAMMTGGGEYNVAIGRQALYKGGGSDNIAIGYGAQFINESGTDNVSIGSSTLFYNKSGGRNTAVGSYALVGTQMDLPGASNNTAVGWAAMSGVASGAFNVAVGSGALAYHTNGNFNTALGGGALGQNTTGGANTAVGYHALFENEDAIDNTAVGTRALQSNTRGASNTSVGESALRNNTIGASNVAIGRNALYSMTGGTHNTALGNNAGYNIANTSDNIDIANQGMVGDTGTIRIGAPSTQKATYIAGIATTQLTGAAVYVNSNGQLGVLASSERYKTAISPMSVDAATLQRLRPVTFHLKTEPNGALQYGLIAEEVDKVYPDLVVHDSAGAIQSVRYDELTSILLKETQQQRETIAKLENAQNQMQTQFAALSAQIKTLQAAAASAR
jgi:hypothetical protein